jgi:protein required for attachment to host cells
MLASEIMTRDVTTVSPTASVREVAKRMVERRLSGVPVVTSDGRLVGMLTASDLLHRVETGTEKHLDEPANERNTLMKAPRTWILLADGHQAKVFETHGPNSDLLVVGDMMVAMELPPNRDIQNDRPGRSFESAGPTRHAMESRTDPHRELKRELARTVSDRLDAALKEGRFDRLCIVAPPATLGDLRRALSQPLKQRIVAEITKDLVHVPHQDLPSHLEAIWHSK